MLYTQSQINAALLTPYSTPLEVIQQMGGTAVLGDEAYLTYHNLNYLYTEAPAFYRQVVLDAANGITPTATEQLVTQPVINEVSGAVEGTTAIKMPEVTTGAGTVKEGALAGRVPLGTLAAGIAIGAGIGIKEVATHEQFWNDLSESIFDKGTTTTPVSVIWRALQDGSIQSYCDKRSVDAIIHGMYQMEAFNAYDDVVPDIHAPGQHIIHLSEMNPGLVGFACSKCGYYNTLVSSMATSAFSRYARANAVSIDVGPNGTDRFNVTLRFYILTDGATYNVVGNASDLSIYLPGTTASNKVGTVSSSFYRTGNTSQYINYSDGYASEYVRVGIRSGSQPTGPTYSVGNVGAVFVPKNENILYNGADILPPRQEGDFWQTYAQWLNNGFTQRYYNPNTNAYEDVTYIPYTAPDINWQVDPITGDQSRVWSGVYDFVEPFTDPTTEPVNNPQPWVYESIGRWQLPDPKIPNPTPWDNNPLFPTPTPGNIGDTPSIIAPTSGAGGSRLYSIYNPTQSQIDALGSYLWTENIIDLISQFFKNNPLDAVISLHMIYTIPQTGESRNIILGYLNSGVSAAIVTSQYVEVDCGDVSVTEFYRNALDYTGTTLQIYLPFIGFRNLKTQDVMGARVNVHYTVDVYTGTCVAKIYVIKANARQLLYIYEGNCSVQIPLTAADRTRLISGLVTAGVSAYTGNPAGVVGGIASIGNNIERSGGYSGNAGAMNPKKPYIIVTRAIDAQASGYNSQYGYPLNKSGKLYNFRGYTRVQSVHVNIYDATVDECKEIERMLKDGIII